MKKNRIIAMGVGMLALVSAQAAFINETFDELLPGTYAFGSDHPTNIAATSWGPDGAAFTIAEGVLSGGAGDYDLFLNQTDGDEWANYTGDAVTNGHFSMDFYMIYACIFSLEGGLSGTEAGMLFRTVQFELQIYTYQGGGSYSWVPFDNVVNWSEHKLVIDFDCDTGTFSGTIDGNPLTMGGGTQTTFGFTNPKSSIDDVTLEGVTTRDFSVDDLWLNPDPPPSEYIDEDFSGYVTNATTFIQGTDSSGDFGASSWDVGSAVTLSSNSCLSSGPGDWDLYLRNEQSSWVMFTGDPLETGTFSMDFATSYNSNWGLEGGLSGSAAGILLRNVASAVQVYNGSAWVPFDNTITWTSTAYPAHPHALAINFDCTTDTFSGTLDGNPLTMGGGTQTVFNFTNAKDSFHDVALQAVANRALYVDNLLMEAWVPVLPPIGDIAVEYLGASGLALTWATAPGFDYELLEKTDLASPTWSTNQTVPGGLVSVTVTDSVDVAEAKFYKVEASE